MNKEDNMMLEKKCSDCEITKDIKEFYTRPTKYGYYNKCKECAKIYSNKYREENKNKIKEYYKENRDIIKEKNKKYYENNKDKVKDKCREYYENNKDKKREYYENNKVKISEYKSEWREENKDIIKEKNRKYYKENRDKLIEYSREWREENKDYFNEYDRNRFSKDPLYKLSKNMRSLIYQSLKGGYTKDSKSADMLGCSYEELLDHLNDNKYGFIYGDDNLDIDHIIPLSRAISEDEMMELNHYTNLQLLPSEYNRYVKRDKDFDSECLEVWLEKNK